MKNIGFSIAKKCISSVFNSFNPQLCMSGLKTASITPFQKMASAVHFLYSSFHANPVFSTRGGLSLVSCWNFPVAGNCQLSSMASKVRSGECIFIFHGHIILNKKTARESILYDNGVIYFISVLICNEDGGNEYISHIYLFK